MRKILAKTEFSLLVLVGDVYQIESIEFGNWFSVIKGFLPKTSIYELTKPYRSNNEDLQILWDAVRKMDDTVEELIAKNKYSVSLDSSIFVPAEENEIILCLNYDGLYGINNINSFLQQSNPNPPFKVGLLTYKKGDPILFNESDRFKPLIYNNIKGRIVNIENAEGKIKFAVEIIDKQITSLDVENYDFVLSEISQSGNSVISFTVDNHSEDNEDIENGEVPFQVSYAVSIHKAQGLEFNSVKIVITDEIEDHITHSIFYTAITRARDKLKIYWSPEVAHRILNTIKPKNSEKDISFLKNILGNEKK
jgi:ATP-dependent exoDNAse (exonuclease V) alpha subunit